MCSGKSGAWTVFSQSTFGSPVTITTQIQLPGKTTFKTTK